MPLDEYRLPIKNVDIGAGYLAVDQQGHADPLEGFEHRGEALDGSHPGGGVGGGVGGVELAGHPGAFAKAQGDLGRVDRIGEIGRQQGLEIAAIGQGRGDALAVGRRRRHGCDRRAEVGHHDRPGELARRGPGHRLQHRPVAQVHMPVIGLAQAEPLAGHR